MIESPVLETEFPLATAGDIAVINLTSARLRSWGKFWQSPQRAGVAEYLVEQEMATLQFLSDATALDRLNALVDWLVENDSDHTRVALIRAQVASTKHHFSDARALLEEAAPWGTHSEAADRLLLSIDQACGNNLDSVLEKRQQTASESRRLEDLVPLGALLADLREFEEADRVYQQGIQSYQDVSPFALAWVCFQLGALWGELVPQPQPDRAAKWYEQAIAYLPPYVKARVHLSEIYLENERTEDAEALLLPALSSGDPEVDWRLADVMIAQGDTLEGDAYLESATRGFEALLAKHLLAFADHGAEFYAGSGNNPARAFELARVNLLNRPTLRAFEQTYETAIGAGQDQAVSEIISAVRTRWGSSHAFSFSIFTDLSG